MADTDEDGPGNRSKPDSVYSGPERARRAAQKALAEHSSEREKAIAAITLGRSAYYDNRIEDSIHLLETALEADLDQSERDEAQLILAPALSKAGRAPEALNLLDLLEENRSSATQAKALNQRGAILVEQGDHAEALDAFTRSAAAHRRNGDIAGEGRAVLNMGAVASEIGDHRASEQHYERAWQLNLEAGQAVMCAMIEGNLGYVASRKGDFAAALTWYERGRQSFAELGDVELLRAVLEVDHATTLLDIGMYAAARRAAEFAQRSSHSGENLNMTVQSEILLAEALLNLGQHEQATAQLEMARPNAELLGLRAWSLRAEHLLLRVRAEHPAGASAPPQAQEFIHVADAMVRAEWHREALRTVAAGAVSCASWGDTPGVESLLSWAAGADLERTDPIDRHLLDAATASVFGDQEALSEALERGFRELDRLRHLVGSAELRSRLGSRSLQFRELALDFALRDANVDTIQKVYDKTRLTPSLSHSNSQVSGRRAALRDLRVRQQESRLSGDDVSRIDIEMAMLETELSSILDRRPDPQMPKDSGHPALSITRVTYIAHRQNLMAVVESNGRRQLARLGDLGAVARLIRAQRAALRRLTTSASDRDLSRTSDTSKRLQEMLIAPLALDEATPVVLFPEQATSAVSWSALPDLRSRPVLIGTDAGFRRSAPISVNSMAALDGGSIAHGPSEVQSIASLWASELSNARASISTSPEEAADRLGVDDLVHIAAHGSFRSDNPFMSSLEFSGENLYISQLEDAASLPSMVVLASCDGGASASVGAETAGTTEALLAQGVRIVIAPDTIVDDAASSRFVLDLHRQLLAGLSPAEARALAQQAAIDRRSAADVAVALVFQLYGSDEAAFRPLQISRI